MSRLVLFRVTLACLVVDLTAWAQTPASRMLIAHRGASACAPEHTLAAYRLAVEQGADYVEQDLAVTRDGALICLHDESLDDDQVLQELAALLPRVPRTFLIEVAEGPRWLTDAGLTTIRSFATGIGPSKLLIDRRADLVQMAHTAGLTVTPYTFTTRGPATRLSDVRAEMEYYLATLGVDAVFTDNPDRFPRDRAR